MKKYKKHGDARASGKTKLYSVWKQMKRRVKTRSVYIHKNITICEEWINDYQAFKDWALSNGYAEGLQIDRIKNDLGYFPGNCRWVTNIINSNNRDNVIMVEYRGETLPLLILLRRLNKQTNRQTIYGRIKRCWSIEDAINIPI
jgi:hypothetical protein